MQNGHQRIGAFGQEIHILDNGNLMGTLLESIASQMNNS